MNTCYACATNKARNSIEMSLFEENLRETHPRFDDNNRDPPDHTILIKAEFFLEKVRNQYLTIFIISLLTHVEITTYKLDNIKR